MKFFHQSLAKEIADITIFVEVISNIYICMYVHIYIYIYMIQIIVYIIEF